MGQIHVPKMGQSSDPTDHFYEEPEMVKIEIQILVAHHQFVPACSFKPSEGNIAFPHASKQKCVTSQVPVMARNSAPLPSQCQVRGHDCCDLREIVGTKNWLVAATLVIATASAEDFLSG
jgi:hypothetical protein